VYEANITDEASYTKALPEVEKNKRIRFVSKARELS
jgi:hypothetical protein